MARFCTLSSSSNGNCEFLFASGEGLLIDAGISCKRIIENLQDINADIESILGIIITHCHSDHICGLKTLCNKYHFPIYATKETVEYLKNNSCIDSDTECNIINTKDYFEIGSMRIKAFDTMHDAPGSVGYIIETSDEHKVAIATDLGVVTKEVEENVFGSDLILLEANHDPYMLKIGPYPKELKNRISSPYGHLSNSDAASLACKMMNRGTRFFVLGHLSENNNTPSIAERTILGELCKIGKRGVDFELIVSPAKTCGKIVRF